MDLTPNKRAENEQCTTRSHQRRQARSVATAWSSKKPYLDGNPMHIYEITL